MDINTNYSKLPSIKIYFDKNDLTENDFMDLMFGIEEEGIPFETCEMECNDAVYLGYQASLESKLGVGLGVSKDRVVLHYNKLDKDDPIYNINLRSNAEKIRALGSNAARLVIKMPFRVI